MRPSVFDGRDAINFMENLGEIGLGGKSGRPGDIGYRVAYLLYLISKSQPPLQVVVWVGPHKGRLHARPKGRVSQALSLVRL